MFNIFSWNVYRGQFFSLFSSLRHLNTYNGQIRLTETCAHYILNCMATDSYKLKALFVYSLTRIYRTKCIPQKDNKIQRVISIQLHTSMLI